MHDARSSAQGPEALLRLANDNAAGQWLSRADLHGWPVLRGEGFVAVRCARTTAGSDRVVITGPPRDATRLAEEIVDLLDGWAAHRVCVEDPYAAIDLTAHRYEESPPRSVLVRAADRRDGPDAPATAPAAAGAAGLRVRPVAGNDELSVAERLIVEHYPVPAMLPWRRGTFLPPGLLGVAGWRVWLARRAGEPAGACLSWDDGRCVGLYSMTGTDSPTAGQDGAAPTAAALAAAVLAAHPGRPAALTMPPAADRAYRALGFARRGVARWWRRPGVTGAAAALRAGRPRAAAR